MSYCGHCELASGCPEGCALGLEVIDGPHRDVITPTTASPTFTGKVTVFELPSQPVVPVAVTFPDGHREDLAAMLAELAELRAGTRVPLPQSIDHAQAMLRVAAAYLDQQAGRAAL